MRTGLGSELGSGLGLIFGLGTGLGSELGSGLGLVSGLRKGLGSELGSGLGLVLGLGTGLGSELGPGLGSGLGAISGCFRVHVLPSACSPPSAPCSFQPSTRRHLRASAPYTFCRAWPLRPLCAQPGTNSPTSIDHQAKESSSNFGTLVLIGLAAVVCAVLTPFSARRLHAAG